MNLTIKDFQNFQGSGAIVISREQGYRNPEIEEASFLHKVKSFFGFSSAKAKNQETVDALRNAIRNDPSLYLASHEADRLLGQVKGAITAEKVRNILDTLTMKLSEGEETYKKMARDTISGHIAAKPPFFLQGKGLDKNQQFMAWYNKAAASYVVDKPGEKVPDSWGKVSADLKDFNKFFDRCLNVFGGNKQHIKAFAAMCSGENGTMLGVGPQVTADLGKTLEKVINLKRLFDKADSLGEEHGRGMKLVLLTNIISHPNVFSADMLEQAVEDVTSIQMLALKKLKPTASKEEIVKAFREALSESEYPVEHVMNKVSLGKDMVDPKKMLRYAQRLTIQCAVAFSYKEDRQNLFSVLNGLSGQELRADLANDRGSVRFMYDILAEAADLTSGMKLE